MPATLFKKRVYTHLFSIDGDFTDNTGARQKFKREIDDWESDDWEDRFYRTMDVDTTTPTSKSHNTASAKPANVNAPAIVNSASDGANLKGFVFNPKVGDTVYVWCSGVSTYLAGKIIATIKNFASPDRFEVRPFGTIYKDITAPLSDLRKYH